MQPLKIYAKIQVTDLGGGKSAQLFLKPADNINVADFISQNVRVHGAAFQVFSTTPLDNDQTKQIVEALERFPSKVVQALSRGRDGEPPLRIVIASGEDMYTFSPLVAKAFYKLFLPSWYHLPRAFYDFTANTVAISSSLLLESTDSYIRRVLTHEIAHAVDDFAVTRFMNGISNLEVGCASEFLFQPNFVEKNSTFITTLMFEASSGISGILHYIDKREEVFAVASEIGIDIFNPDHKPHVNKYPHFGSVFSQDYGKIVFESLKTFYEQYPNIERVSPKNQFQLNIIPPILESSQNHLRAEKNHRKKITTNPPAER